MRCNGEHPSVHRIRNMCRNGPKCYLNGEKREKGCVVIRPGILSSMDYPADQS
jgi:hypothetical protein